MELGNTTSSSTEYNDLITEALYPILDEMGVNAVLLKDYELRDKDFFFIKRLEQSIQHILSNVYPKAPDSEWGNLKQSFTRDLGYGARLYVLNIFDTDNFKYSQIITNNYDVIEPQEFLRKFISQIGSNDVLIARLFIKNEAKLDEFLATAEAKRVDMILLPEGAGEKYLTGQESELSKARGGWVPKPNFDLDSKEDKKKEEDKIKNTPVIPGDQKPAEPSKDEEKTTPEEEKAKEETSNQGGEKISDESDSQSSGSIPGSQSEATKSETPDPNAKSLPVPSVPPPQKPESKPTIDKAELAFDKRQFLPITNEYHIVPEPRSAEFIREIHFKRAFNGTVKIEVSDIILDKQYPDIESIRITSDKIEEQVKVERGKDSIKRQIQNIPRQVSYSNLNPYIGTESCKECHLEAYTKWESSTHAKALESLKKKSAQNKAECLKCHLTAWDRPDNYESEWTFEPFGTELGCESCHGPGLMHTKLIDFATDTGRMEYWDFIKENEKNLFTRDLSVEALATCTKCHDTANSPEFDFSKYWEKIEHPSPAVDDPLKPIFDKKEALRKELAQQQQNAIIPSGAPGQPGATPPQGKDSQKESDKDKKSNDANKDKKSHEAEKDKSQDKKKSEGK